MSSRFRYDNSPRPGDGSADEMENDQPLCNKSEYTSLQTTLPENDNSALKNDCFQMIDFDLIGKECSDSKHRTTDASPVLFTDEPKWNCNSTITDPPTSAISFPQKAFLDMSGMAFLSPVSEISREKMLLLFKLSNELQNFKSRIRSEACNSGSHLETLARRLFEGETSSSLENDLQSLSEEEKEFFNLLVRNQTLISLDADDVLNFENKPIIFATNICDSVKCLTSKFILKQSENIQSVLESCFLLPYKKITHNADCKCFSNPILKYTQVESNIPVSVVSRCFSEAEFHSSTLGRLTEQLAILGRGRRPSQLVFVHDSASYSAIKVDYQHHNIIINSSEFSEVVNKVLRCCTRQDSTLFVVLHKQELSFDSYRTGYSDEEKGDQLEEGVADYLIESSLLLWRAVLFNTRQSDVLFIPVSNSSCFTGKVKLMKQYNRWVRLQQQLTGRCCIDANVGRNEQPEQAEFSLISIKDLMDEVQAVVKQFKLDLEFYGRAAQDYSTVTVASEYCLQECLRVPTESSLSIRRISHVILVVEKKFAACVQHSLKNFVMSIQLCSVQSLSAPGTAHEIISNVNDLPICDGSYSDALVVLLPSAVRADVIESSMETSISSRNGSNIFNCLDCFPEDVCFEASEITENLSVLREKLVKVFPEMMVVTMPCFPIHLFILSQTERYNFKAKTLNFDNKEAICQFILTEDKESDRFQQIYLNCCQGVFNFARDSFESERIGLGHVLKQFGVEDLKFCSFISTSHGFPPTSISENVHYTNFLSTLISTVYCGISTEPLQVVSTLPFNSTYPRLVKFADFENQVPRFSQVVLIGDCVCDSNFAAKLAQLGNFHCFPTLNMTKKPSSNDLQKFARFAHNTLYLFFFDITMLADVEMYPKCTQIHCQNSIPIWKLPSNVVTNADIVKFVSERLMNLLHFVRACKDSLPNQSSVLIAPLCPQRLLLYKYNYSFFNHELLHSSFFNAERRGIVAVDSVDGQWEKFYDACVDELKKPVYTVDASLSSLRNELLEKTEFELSTTDNPRLYFENKFDAKLRWYSVITEFMYRVYQLLFPTENISEQDLTLKESITTTKMPCLPTLPRCSSDLLKRLEFVCETDGKHCNVRLQNCYGGRLPLSFVEAVVSYFDPISTVPSADSRECIVTVPSLKAASLLCAVLHKFRCTLFMVSVTLEDEDVLLPTPTQSELKAMKSTVSETLKVFAFCCDQLFLTSEFFMSSFHDTSVFIEGLDTTLCYVHKELKQILLHKKKAVRLNEVLLLVLTETVEDADSLAWALQQSLLCPELYPQLSCTDVLPSLVTRDIATTRGNVFIGTPRFVMGALHSNASTLKLHAVVIEQIKQLMKEQKNALMSILRTVHSGSQEQKTRFIVVAKDFVNEELSGANALVKETLRLVRRAEDGSAYYEDYDPANLPKVTISASDVASRPVRPSSSSTILQQVPVLAPRGAHLPSAQRRSAPHLGLRPPNLQPTLSLSAFQYDQMRPAVGYSGPSGGATSMSGSYPSARMFTSIGRARMPFNNTSFPPLRMQAYPFQPLPCRPTAPSYYRPSAPAPSCAINASTARSCAPQNYNCTPSLQASGAIRLQSTSTSADVTNYPRHSGARFGAPVAPPTFSQELTKEARPKTTETAPGSSSNNFQRKSSDFSTECRDIDNFGSRLSSDYPSMRRSRSRSRSSERYYERKRFRRSPTFNWSKSRSRSHSRSRSRSHEKSVRFLSLPRNGRYQGFSERQTSTVSRHSPGRHYACDSSRNEDKNGDSAASNFQNLQSELASSSKAEPRSYSSVDDSRDLSSPGKPANNFSNEDVVVDLDPKSLAERTRGLNPVELALLVRELVKAAKVQQPEETFQKLLQQVSTLHIEWVQQKFDV